MSQSGLERFGAYQKALELFDTATIERLRYDPKAEKGETQSVKESSVEYGDPGIPPVASRSSSPRHSTPDTRQNGERRSRT